MATALDLIKKSMRLIGALGQGEEPTASEATDCLNAMNAMLEMWSNERLLVPHILQESLTWAASQSSRTIGTSGDFNTTRPIKIEGGFTRISSIDYPIKGVITRAQYDAIPDKTTESAYPDYLFYDTTYPLGTIYGWPVPSASISFYLSSWKQLQSFTSLTTSLSLPPGYQQLIEYNLPDVIAPEFGKSVPENVTRIAMKSIATIKRVNMPSMVAQLDAGIVGSGYRSDINADQ